MGGGSSVMGMIALRGLPSDYDGWEAAGARNWGWRDVLPYFRAMTCDLDRPGPERNTSGPNIIRRLPREQWPLYAQLEHPLIPVLLDMERTGILHRRIRRQGSRNEGFEARRLLDKTPRAIGMVHGQLF